MKKVALKKLLAAVIIATSITTVFPMKAYADWNKNSNGTWNYTEGNYKVRGWKSVEGTWYFFDNNGDMKTGWIKDNDKWYFASESGAMKNGWVKDGQTWYFTSPSGAMQTGWVKDGDRWYFTNSDGAMKTGWISNNNKWYYSDSSGSMQTGIVEIDGKTYALSKDGEMLTGKVKLGDKTYVFAESGQAIGNDIPHTNKAFAGLGIECSPSNPLIINENNNSELIPKLINDETNIVNNNVDKSDAEISSSSSNSSKHSHNNSSSGGASGGESNKPDNKPTEGDSNNQEENLVKPENPNPIITSSKDLEKLQSNAQYETIILNIKDVFEEVELKNIKTKKLIIKNANDFKMKECVIGEIEVKSNESEPKMKIDELSKVENINFKSGGSIEGSRVKSIYVNTTEDVDIDCGADNIEILKKDSDVSVRGSKEDEIDKILVKEEADLRISNVNLKSLVVLKGSDVSLFTSKINLIEILDNSYIDLSTCQLDEIKASSSAEIKLRKPVFIEKIVSTIDNENEKIKIKGYGTVKNVEEKIDGTILLGTNIIKGDSSENVGNDKNLTIIDKEDMEALQPDVEYETITLNTTNRRVNLENIKAKKLIINNIYEIEMEECIIGEIEVKSNTCKPEIYMDKLSKVENINFKSGAYFKGSKTNSINNIYINTSENINISGIGKNIEILKANSKVHMNNFEADNISVKEQAELYASNCNIKSLNILKESNVELSDSKLNIMNILIDNENDKVIIKGYGTINSIYEKVNGSVMLGEDIIRGDYSEEIVTDKNPIITNNKDLKKLQLNAEYETITLNIKDIFEKIELKNIKTKKLIIKNANDLDLKECIINELEVNANESKPEIEINKLSKIENVNLKSGVEFYGGIVKNIYVNTTESVDINCEVDNIEILKKDSNVRISDSLENEIDKILVKDETKLTLSHVNLKSLVILKDSKIRLLNSKINLIEILDNSDFDVSSCKIDEIKASSSAEIELNKPVTIDKITSTIDNENEKIKIEGYGTINSIYEKINGSVVFGENVDEKDRSAKLVSSGESIENTELTTTNKDLIEEESTINNENLILEENDTKNVLDSEDKVSEIKYNEVVKPNSDINEKNTNNINATSKDESKTSNTNVILEDNSIK
ncbi:MULTISPECIES: N-acetylmuramoyl-L-alanine amidase family protein [unclassified Clostridium]|uniref:N-acetylmuramoyl-L-alanine amidase family protein n=1 Tax=unclassified Clostridium TaxID=2614128 RepID=UPI0013FA3825|nr:MULTISPECIES: N-acetylmuramoyl-L-alanine amidase family protein [unclassified Clostridium]NFR87580.1 N-acetylmuramoyl-L-alanine amidase family protein [Clostridium botulinum]NFR90707.1 N-acetylmuramoyl-L-alanine amidase family protein [Clostridium botulinum]